MLSQDIQNQIQIASNAGATQDQIFMLIRYAKMGEWVEFRKLMNCITLTENQAVVANEEMPIKRLPYVKWFNVFLLQWFFVRLAYSNDAFYLIGFILPVTGWFSNYVYLPLLKKIDLKIKNRKVA